MLSKDLLHALQTRSRRLIRELETFTGNIKSVSPQDGWALVIETMALVRELTPAHDKYIHVLKAVNRAWMAFAEQSDAAADALYLEVTDALVQTDWEHEGQAQAAYQLLYAFHANHLRGPGTNAHLRHGLRQQSPRLLSLVGHLVPYGTQTLFKAPVAAHTGTGWDAIGMQSARAGWPDGGLRRLPPETSTTARSLKHSLKTIYIMPALIMNSHEG